MERRFSEREGGVDFGLCYPYPEHQTVLQGDALLARRVPFLWLEIDGSRVTKRSRPNALLCVDARLSRKAFGRVVPRLRERPLLDIAAAGHRLFVGSPLASSLRGSLRQCFRALPERGTITHISFMPRSSPVTKLNVSLPKRALVPYLREVGWPGSFSALSAAWRRLAPAVQSAKIDLTLSPGVRPKIGLEVVPSNASLAGRRAVLRWLEREGLAEERQSEALAAWHGKVWTLSGNRPTPVELDFGMKVVIDAASKLDAKAYLHFTSESVERER